MRAHEEEIERQRDAVDAVDAEAAEEGRINRDLATVMVARLDAGRRAAEKLLGVLQVSPDALTSPKHAGPIVQAFAACSSTCKVCNETWTALLNVPASRECTSGVSGCISWADAAMHWKQV